MLVIKIKSGLGNQMFQYAFGRSLSLRRNESLFLDVSYYKNQPQNDAKRELIIDKFNIKATILSEEESKKYNSSFRIILRKLHRLVKKTDAYTFYPSITKSKGTYYEGYWANQKYFIEYEDIIRKDLSLKKPFENSAKSILSEIENCSLKNEISVSLHIRRGDFVTNPQSAFNGLVGIPFYEKAAGLIASRYKDKKIKLFVFSDDIQWARDNLKLLYQINLVSSPEIHDYEEITLMSRCMHHIIANSTFSWWGAWLNPKKDKIVVAPKQWLKDKTAEELDILPPEWIRI